METTTIGCASGEVIHSRDTHIRMVPAERPVIQCPKQGALAAGIAPAVFGEVACEVLFQVCICPHLFRAGYQVVTQGEVLHDLCMPALEHMHAAQDGNALYKEALPGKPMPHRRTGQRGAIYQYPYR